MKPIHRHSSNIRQLHFPTAQLYLLGRYLPWLYLLDFDHCCSMREQPQAQLQSMVELQTQTLHRQQRSAMERPDFCSAWKLLPASSEATAGQHHLVLDRPLHSEEAGGR
jgi:hypothetical protein